MKQMVFLSHSSGISYLEDTVNEWLISMKDKNIDIDQIYVPSGGIVVIVYDIKDEKIQEEVIQKLKKRKKDDSYYRNE